MSHKPRLMGFVRLTRDVGANVVVDIKRMIDEAMAMAKKKIQEFG